MQYDVVDLAFCILLCFYLDVLYTVATTTMSVAIYISMTMIPISATQSSQQTSQIVSGILLFALILKERITIRILLSSVLCIAGIILVIQPDFLFPIVEISESKSFNGTSSITNTTINTEHTDYGFFENNLDSKWSQVIGYVIAAVAGVFITLDVYL